MANTFYFDHGLGTGGNDGTTLADAWQDFSDILWSGVDGVEINAGDTLYVLDTATSAADTDFIEVGVTGTAALPVTIRGDYPGREGTIAAAATGTRTIRINGYDYINIQDLTLTGGISDCVKIENAENCTFTSLKVSGAGASGFLVDTCTDLAFTDCISNTNTEYGYELANVSGIAFTDCVGSTNVKGGLFCQGNTTSDDITVTRGIYNGNDSGDSNTYSGIQLNIGSGLTIDGATCSSNDAAGISCGNVTGGVVYNVDCVVQNCICESNTDRGIGLTGTNIICDSNKGKDNGAGPAGVPGATADIKAGDGNGGTLRISNNTSDGFLGTASAINASGAIANNQAAKTTSMYNNRATNCAGNGYKCGDDDANDTINFYNNIADTCATTGFLLLKKGTYNIFNNTFYNSTTYGVDLSSTGAGTQTIVFKNNIIDTSATYAIRWTDSSGGTLDSDFNVIEDGTTGFALYNTAVATFAVWQALNIDVNSSQSDPLFTNGSYGNFRIKFGSPAINLGIFDGAPTTDILGNARAGDPDAGAYEYVGAQQTLTNARICNMALGKIGTKKIESFGDESENTDQAIQCNLHFEQTRDALMRSHWWRFASARSELTEDSSSPDFEWDNQFILPTDFLRFKSIYEETGVASRNRRHAIEGNLLLTDLSEVSLRYIKKVTNPASFDELFVEVFVLVLALKLVGPLAGGAPRLQDKLQKELDAVMPKVFAVDMDETDVGGRSDWNLSRHGGIGVKSTDERYW